MAEEDFRINIGLDATGGGTQGSKGTENMAMGMSKGLKMAGVVGILSSLKVVTDVIGVTLGLLQVGIVSIVGFIGGLFGMFLTKVVPFFEDPFRSLLRFGVFLVNGIISGLELVLNGILGFFGVGSIELPRFQETLVLEAYDEFKMTMEDLASKGKTFSSDAVKATISFMKGIGESFMKNSEFQELMQERIIESQNSTSKAIDSTKVFADALGSGFDSAYQSFDPAFNQMSRLADLLMRKSQEVARKLGNGSGFSQSSANIEYGNATMQSTTLSEKQAKSGLYLLSKGIGG